MFERRRGTWLTVMLLIAAMAGLIGHVCVVPVHAHAVPVEGHGSHDEDAADRSVHTTSCEAAKGGLSVHSLGPRSHVIEPLPIAPRLLSMTYSGQVPDSLAAESPPLFLLHAALLI
jgi:hypothetical protein